MTPKNSTVTSFWCSKKLINTFHLLVDQLIQQVHKLLIIFNPELLKEKYV